LLAFGGATLLIALVAGLGGVAPWIRANLTVVVAGVFLYLPAWLLDRRGENAGDRGLTLRPLGRNAWICAVVCVAVFPAYAAGFHIWQTQWQGGRWAPSEDSYRRFAPVGGDWLTGERTLEGRPSGPASADQVRVWTDGDRQIVDWGALGKQARYRLTDAGGEQVRPAGPKAGWRIHRPSGDSWVLEVEPPISLVAGGPSSPVQDGRLRAERSTSWIFWLVVTQLLLVAIPEEFFYRAYLQGAFARAWPGARRRVLGVATNPAALVATSALFALGHFAVGFDPQRLAVFFPSLLFGWMKDATGSIAAAAVFHALCNIVVDVLSKAYLH